MTLAAGLGVTSGSAHAGGYDLPDLGTEALGRGAAFVAKASDGTALYHNPAGLARQRGSNLLVNGNLYFHSFEFQRLGEYPDTKDNDHPWGGALYPAVKNVPQTVIAPMIVLTTDFGYFDRLTFAAGLFSPSSLINRTFPLALTGPTPSPSRYDFVQSRSSMLMPTLAAGFRATRWLDVGVSAHLVLANIDQTMVGYTDLGSPPCSENAADGQKRREDFKCDTEAALKVSGTTIALTLGAMARPTPWLAIGASFRTPTNISASGTLTPTPPIALPDGDALKTSPANLSYQLPWAAKVGARYIGMDRDFEVYDLELDATYEGWGSAQRDGPILTAQDIGTFAGVQTIVTHGYKNTLGLRAGGGYNIDLGQGIFALRAGAYFDSSATEFAQTRLDYDTLPKIAGTLGAGYKIGAFSFDLAYAAVASMPRTVGVGAGAIRPINLADGGSSNGKDKTPLATINDGLYRGFTHIISLGASVAIDGLFGPPRRIQYGNSYEPNYDGPRDPDDEPPPKPVEKPAAEKPAAEKPAAEKPAAEKPVESGVAEKPEPSPKAPASPEAPAPAAGSSKKVRKPPTKRKEWWENPN